MDLDKLNFLPDWEDDHFNTDRYGDDDEGEEWKTEASRAAAKAMYLKWREVFGLVIAFAENLTDEPDEDGESHEQITKRFIYENAMIVAPNYGRCWLWIICFTNGKCSNHTYQLQTNDGTGRFCCIDGCS